MKLCAVRSGSAATKISAGCWTAKLGPPSLQNLGLGANLTPPSLQNCKTWASGPNLGLQVLKTWASRPARQAGPQGQPSVEARLSPGPGFSKLGLQVAKLGPRGQTWATKFVKFAKLGVGGQTWASKFAKLGSRGQTWASQVCKTWASKFAKLGPRGQTWASGPNLGLQVCKTWAKLGPPSLQNVGRGAKLGPPSLPNLGLPAPGKPSLARQAGPQGQPSMEARFSPGPGRLSKLLAAASVRSVVLVFLKDLDPP